MSPLFAVGGGDIVKEIPVMPARSQINLNTELVR